LARLNGPCSWGLYGPLVARLDAKRKQASPCWAVYHVNLLKFGPSIARLLNAAQAIFGPPGIFK